MTVLLVAACYFSHKGIRLSEEVRIPGLLRILSPSHGLWQNYDDEYFTKSESISLSGPNSEIRVYFDDRKVPHIFADTDEDVLFAQGYIVASQRLWQMDFLSRVAEGTLSEVFGKPTLKNDLMMRKYGLKYGAEQAIKDWEKNDHRDKLYISYENGINAYINRVLNNTEELPYEFKLANYKPRLWNAYLTALVSKYMAFTLCRRHEDIAATNTRELLGDSLYQHLFLKKDQNQIPVIREHSGEAFQAKRSKPADAEYRGYLKEMTVLKQQDKGIGSNNWAISGSMSKTGSPILANDPHLGLSLPSIWFENHIHTPSMNAYGVTIPGIPGMPIGFNDDIAFGSTNVGQDVLDLFTINWTNKEEGKYKVNGQERTAEMYEEVIKIRNKPDLTYKQYITEYGPIMYESRSDGADLAVHWLAHLPLNPNEISVFFNILKCKDYDCYKRETGKFSAPAQNFIFASNNGDIGIRINGKLPIKYENEGRFVKNGNQIENKWSEFIPRTANPQTLNPSLGFVSSANQITIDSFGLNFNGGFENYRGRRINNLLEKSTKKLDHQDMMDFQQDAFSIKASEMLPVLLKNLKRDTLDAFQKELLTTLENWDYVYNAESQAPPLFESWSQLFQSFVWDEMHNDSISYMKPSIWRTLELIDLEPSHTLFDHLETEKIEDAIDNINLSFGQLTTAYRSKESKNWKERNRVSINHLLNIPGYSKYELDVNGCGDALNAVKGGFGPSWRMVVELGENPKAWAIYPGGQSGNPLSKYYDNMIDDWAKGEYYELSFKDEDYFKSNHLFSRTILPDNE